MFRSPFTVAQWQELENQALIFKHLLAGVPVPPSLLLSIRRSFGSVPACLYTHPTPSYYSYFGKKLDPEPGRCRRTDGKKWRCAKDAYPDSKYCERHMHRGKSKTRSRKLVESQTLYQLKPSLSPSTVTTSCTPSGPANKSILNDSLQFSVTSGGSGHCLNSSSKNCSSSSFINGEKSEVDNQNFIPEASNSAKGFVIDSSLDTSVLSYPQFQKSSYMGNQFDLLQPFKQESSYVRPYCDEWPKTRDMWSDFEDDRWSHTTLSKTQLSISTPTLSSDFPTISSRFSFDD